MSENAANKKSSVPIKAKTISFGRGSVAKRGDKSRQPQADDRAQNLTAGNILEPRYNIEDLEDIFSQSNLLRQCVDALKTNIAGYGYKVVPIAKDVEMDPAEKEFLEDFVRLPNADSSLTTINLNMNEDMFRIGGGAIEILRNSAREITGVKHLPSRYLRLVRIDENDSPVSVSKSVKRGSKTLSFVEHKLFRRYVWVRPDGKKIWFKEFGDPRRMDYLTGEYGSRENPIPQNRLATEVIYFKEYETSEEYGKPKWLHVLASILGSRESEETNLTYFADNMVPAGILAVSGGHLTAECQQQLEEMLNAGIGKDRQNKILLMEALAQEQWTEGGQGKVDIDFIALAGERPSDGLFDQYDKNNQAKIRSVYRLSASLIGLSEDVNFATANTSLAAAETQVFAPARRKLDEVFNRQIINNMDSGFGLRTVKLESLGPEITNPDAVVKALTALNTMGGLTPRKAVKFMAENLNMVVDQYPSEGEDGYQEWMDKPIQIAMRPESDTEGMPDALQKAKTEELKNVEAEGDIKFTNPENGDE